MDKFINNIMTKCGAYVQHNDALIRTTDFILRRIVITDEASAICQTVCGFCKNRRRTCTEVCCGWLGCSARKYTQFCVGPI
ncbi:MAG: hypothetical protein GFH27_549287n302 [Chloroflexi bacterium AL-W]|nr:hypothetical protein [Chloroflexi bacterium AL-N1]NOK66576.1 hypothetical protein [Chloroflexi bacterium AL-N10]NOK71964.1 hypothetical protein [Chloroflexi bacterium AL-N5]NOK81221.1 hypothetical protein [Chloroflexi bacterium AL-W]NOK89494.1 hypothetical protein [Chloroflexi bacterium AL-N15]